SVTGVGLIVASVLISTTGNFTKFTNYRQYACYCGVAPFEHSSGTSIHSKTKVSKMANIKIKTYVTRSAISARLFDEQTKNYYKRKINEGKHKESVKNAIKCKIIARCFAVVRRGTPYVNLQI
ncbi:MAG: IS110 family transposase, partial [Rikenellaceae bacterium]